jgi:hypothetical protein
MAVLMFKDQFAELVSDGLKKQTIRPLRKRPIKPGQPLSLRKWSGAAYRSPQVTLHDSICTKVSTIFMDESFHEFTFVVDGERLNQEQYAKLARADGFHCTTDMLNWFRASHGLPFDGVMIHWE